MIVLEGPVGGLRGDERKTLISAPESRYAVSGVAIQARCVVGADVVLNKVLRLSVLRGVLNLAFVGRIVVTSASPSVHLGCPAMLRVAGVGRGSRACLIPSE